MSFSSPSAFSFPLSCHLLVGIRELLPLMSGLSSSLMCTVSVCSHRLLGGVPERKKAEHLYKAAPSQAANPATGFSLFTSRERVQFMYTLNKEYLLYFPLKNFNTLRLLLLVLIFIFYLSHNSEEKLCSCSLQTSGMSQNHHLSLKCSAKILILFHLQHCLAF